ncbi:MAG: hypothetical protein LAT81_16430 [Oceanicaulis sp.]|nr:hypothetical protein [Oceanicaulis sp.]
MKSIGGVLILICVFFVIALVTWYLPNDTEADSTPDTCDIGSPISGQLFVTEDEVPFFEQPDTNSNRIVNQRASDALGSAQERTLWRSMVLNAECADGDWVRAKIANADGRSVSWESGWVQRAYVSDQPSPERRAGLIWNVDGEDAFTDEEKALVKQGALRALRDEPDCRQIVDGYYSGDSDQRFYVTCSDRNGDNHFNIRFTLDDVRSDRSIRKPRPVSETWARDECHSAIRARAANPSTIQFRALTGYSNTLGNDSTRTVQQRFSAANAMGHSQTFLAVCIFPPGERPDISILEL